MPCKTWASDARFENKNVSVKDLLSGPLLFPRVIRGWRRRQKKRSERSSKKKKKRKKEKKKKQHTISGLPAQERAAEAIHHRCNAQDAVTDARKLELNEDIGRRLEAWPGRQLPSVAANDATR